MAKSCFILNKKETPNWQTRRKCILKNGYAKNRVHKSFSFKLWYYQTYKGLEALIGFNSQRKTFMHQKIYTSTPYL